MPSGFKDLEQYGIIGNLETCALVGSDGSIDWLCLPYTESPSVFAALLDAQKGGFMSIEPRGKYSSMQSYIEGTNVLQTTFNTPLGIARVTDFMPLKRRDEAAPFLRAVIRKVEWLKKGEAVLDVRFRPVFDYGRRRAELLAADGGVSARGGDGLLYLQSPVPLDIGDGEATGEIRGRNGEAAWFVIRYGSAANIGAEALETGLKAVRESWSAWSHACAGPRCPFDGPWHDLIVRSGLVLKLLSNPESGVIAAAPTTSLPESIGGVRNWDYRFAWIRDSAFTAQALYHLEHVREADQYRKWIKDIVCGCEDPSTIGILYGLHGGSDLDERIIRDLSGYRGSAPVRCGNQAHLQRQLDIYGELINTMYDTTRYGAQIEEENWPMVRNIVDYVCGVWGTKDSGIWEVRGAPQHFVYSKLMCWVALDRGIKMAGLKGFKAPLEKWGAVEEEIRKAILEKGWSRRLNSFVRAFGSEELDSTSLLIPFMGFLPFKDPRVQGTIEATMKHLVTGEGLVDRYRSDDGLPGGEGSFVLCSFWLITSLILSGRVEEAKRMFMKVLTYISPLGLLSEEIDPATGRLLGNFPQAFSHIGLINTALHLGIALGKSPAAPRPIGERGTTD